MAASILVGDCREVLKTLADNSVNCCVTSPPYWGLRNYGVGGQLGLEPNPESYVANLVQVFREVRRVLMDDGTLWLNLGDSYSSRQRTTQVRDTLRDAASGKHANLNGIAVRPGRVDDIKPKNLIGIPWRVAFALQADGWYLRQDIIWHKPNPMPESVTDRCTKAHEYVFLIAKSAKYYYDAAAIAEDSIHAGKVVTLGDKSLSRGQAEGVGVRASRNGKADSVTVTETRNKRSVWTVTTSPYRGTHFATFPPKLIEPCILAGCPEGGIVLDPFGGAGTTGLVADRLHRNALLIELNPEYSKMAEARIRGESPLFASIS